MKTKLFMFATLFCCLLSAQSFAVNSDAEANKPKEKIELEKSTSTTRSATGTTVEAYADEHLLTVSVENYTGDVYVQVFGANGAVKTVFAAHNSGYGVLDISALPAGTYTVQVTLDYTYVGTFEK